MPPRCSRSTIVNISAAMPERGRGGKGEGERGEGGGKGGGGKGGGGG